MTCPFEFVCDFLSPKEGHRFTERKLGFSSTIFFYTTEDPFIIGFVNYALSNSLLLYFSNLQIFNPVTYFQLKFKLYAWKILKNLLSKE